MRPSSKQSMRHLSVLLAAEEMATKDGVSLPKPEKTVSNKEEFKSIVCARACTHKRMLPCVLACVCRAGLGWGVGVRDNFVQSVFFLPSR